jgi:indolepyruvate ferredoxin oxidoreductase beta subunit
VKAFSREHHVFDMSAAAREAGTVVSAVMLGAIAGSGLFPFSRAAYEAVVRGADTAAPEKVSRMAAASLRGFAAAFDAVGTPRAHAAFVTDLLASPEPGLPDPSSRLPDLSYTFPPQVQDLFSLGHARLIDYQDAAYASLYVNRLKQVLEAERSADPAGARDFATTREMARWLALWMAFDDIVRVAELKSRASRTQRVREEVKAGDDDIVKVYDHFKPGAPEFAALLPQALATRVTRWDRARQARGRTPWALPLKVGSHAVLGMASLRFLASLKWLRKIGSRFAQEQALIERWLSAVVAGTREHHALGHEIALCGRLIKGYGSTNERGKDNLLHVIDHLATLPGKSPEERAHVIAAARTAALTDDAGKAFDAALLHHGAPARPVKAQPIRWMRRPVQEGKP